MSAVEPRTETDDARMRREEAELRAAWETPRGWRHFSACNNQTVGLWYTGASFFFFLFAGVLALIIRAQLAVPGNDLVSPGTYNQLFTLHGTMMMFLFAVPIFEAVAILILPQMLAARDLPFPRLSAFGFWCFLIGGVFVGGSILFNAAPDSGWFMYPPLATDTEQTGIGADIWLLGLSFIEIASIAAAVELIVGVLKCRPPGMRINLMPLYAWYVLIVGGMILFAFPPLIAGDILFEMQRLFDWPFFDAARGGDPVLWQHLFWIFGHPEVYIIFLPSIALLAMIVPTFARRPILGYGWIVLAAVGTGFLSFGLWAHHMFTIGLPWLSLGFFSAASEAVAIPTGVQIFVFVATLLAGRAIFSIPMLFATGALAIFVFGGLTGVMVALAPFDWQAHDSYFIVAHLHYTLIGGMFFPLIAGLYYFYPFVVGRMLSARLGRWSFWLMFAGFNIAFLPMHITGLRGMPRRVYTYPEGLGWDWLNLVSTVGAFTMAAGVLVMVWDALRPGKPRAPRNPWNAGTLEWVAGDPSEPWGIRSVPPIRSRYPLWDQPNLIREIDEGKFYLPGAPEGKRETLITDVLDATPLQVLRVPGNSFKPLIAAVLIGGSFIATTFHWWLLAIASGALGIAAIMVWLWTGTAAIPEKPERGAGLGVTLPLYASGPASVGWWAMFITMVGDGTAFISLVFAYFYYWTIHPAFPPAGMAPPDGALMLGGGAAALAAWAAMLGARRANGGGHAGRVRLLIGAAALLSVAGAALLLLAPWQAGLDPVAHVYPATVWVLVLWTALHLGVGVLMQGYCLAGALAGRLTARHDIDLRNVVLYGHFAFLTVATTLAVLVLAPRAT
ncbi:cytochrome c oxidase subunit I [Ancylobacter dichloromethanicus]|uniref:cytochrome-c oxidase n=1 Tax=Ancylobacter dichloromethanicus TaxID=518825 RepID=A0A9W6JE76_9HYPH|nr:cytochrome c oxidase subunit I [Ancylobacter dichloromethanicus]MBS7552223.1 cytochrome c oxidase subunit I [Ancylobacter dichloromethanicus]GLK73958.1 cytochrome c oxidase subunit I [Ancylobacter dichloromethanicus]